jgi:hypothetical protein
MARRRLVTVALVGALLVGGLTACRAENGSAAFIGDTRISSEQVQDVLDGLKTNGLEIDPTREGEARREVTSAMIFVEVAKRYAKAHDYPEPTLAPQSIAAKYQLPANDKFVQLLAESQGYSQLLEQQITPATVTEADYLAAADHAIAQGVGSPAQRTDIAGEIKAQFGQEMGRGIAVRDELAKAVKQYNVSVNPRFAPASTALVSAPTAGGATVNLVVLPLTNGAGEPPAVIDVTRNG